MSPFPFDLRALGGDDRATLDKRARLYMGTRVHSSEGPHKVENGAIGAPVRQFSPFFSVLEGAAVGTVAVHVEEDPRPVRQPA